MTAEKKTGKIRPKGEAVREEIVLELKHLRAAVREAGENFILRREGEIETIIGHLAAVPASPLKAEAPAWLHDIRDLKLKTAKGRLKDLKALACIIDGLAERIMAIQDRSKDNSRDRKA